MKNRKGFTLAELLAVIVILAVVILIAVTAVVPRMNSARKKAFADEALIYINAAEKASTESIINGGKKGTCFTVDYLNQNYIDQKTDSYEGFIQYDLSAREWIAYLKSDKYVINGKGGNISNNDVEESQNITSTPSRCVGNEGCETCTSRIADLVNQGDMKIGDFITYDAGTWTAEEINGIKIGPNSSLVSASGDSALPATNFQFGGFTAGMSRNEGATPYGSTYNYAYMYDNGLSAIKERLSGWRLWDIDDQSGTIWLVSAANPEDYRHEDATEVGYKAEYILTGNINAKWTEKNTAAQNYTKRDWSMYINSSYNAKDARMLTSSDLNAWFNKYISPGADPTDAATFGLLYSEPFMRYSNLVDNHSFCWTGSARSAKSMSRLDPKYMYETGNYNYALGIRVLVALPIDSYVKTLPIGDRTVTLNTLSNQNGTHGANTTINYNIWELK